MLCGFCVSFLVETTHFPHIAIENKISAFDGALVKVHHLFSYCTQKQNKKAKQSKKKNEMMAH